MKRIFVRILVAFLLVFSTSANAKNTCYPEFEISKFTTSSQSSEESEDKSVFIYFDQSI